MSRVYVAVLAAAAALMIALAARADEKPPVAPPPMQVTSTGAGVVNLNDASSEELERLPGIGPAKARLIVDHRHAHPFRKVDELTKVKGIGKKTFGKLRPYITIFGPTTLKNEVRRN